MLYLQSNIFCFFLCKDNIDENYSLLLLLVVLVLKREKQNRINVVDEMLEELKNLMIDMDLLLNVDFDHWNDLFSYNQILFVENRQFSSRRNFTNWTNEMMIVLSLHSVFSVLAWQNWPKNKYFPLTIIGKSLDFLTTNRRPSTISRSIRRLASSASFLARNVTNPKP